VEENVSPVAVASVVLVAKPLPNDFNARDTGLVLSGYFLGSLRVCSERGELPIMEYETPSIPD
jgi:hypothetical protein